MPIAPNSSVAGILQPSNVIPDDQALELSLNPTIAQITGLDGNKYIRPRWQPDPPVTPDRATNWVALGITRRASPTVAATKQIDALTAAVIRYQEFDILLSWYGPDSGSLGAIFADGLQIGQNRDLLRQYDFGIVTIGDATRAPDLFKEKFRNRYDQTLTLRRRTERIYSVEALVGFGITLHTDPVGETPVTINYMP